MDALAVLVEFFQGRGEWEACARWCDRAIILVKHLPPPLEESVASPSRSDEVTGEGSKTEVAPPMLAILLTLRGVCEALVPPMQRLCAGCSYSSRVWFATVVGRADKGARCLGVESDGINAHRLAMNSTPFCTCGRRAQHACLECMVVC